MKKIILLLIAVVIISTSCSEQPATSPETADVPIYGVWTLDEIILATKGYSGETRINGYQYVSEAEYIGSEVEYTPEFFRLDDKKYYSPTYKEYNRSFYYYNLEGSFEHPNLYDLVEAGELKIDNMENYEDLGDMPLVHYHVGVEREEDDYWEVPLGNVVVLLNDDTMLVGERWHVILAHRKTA